MIKRTWINFIFYIVFAGYALYKIFDVTSITTKVTIAVISAIILLIALYYEYLQFLYRKAIYQIAFLKDKEKARKTFDLLLKKDVFKAFKNNEKIFMTFYYIDGSQFKECLQILDDNHRFFHSSLDMLLVDHFSRFYSHYQMHNTEEMKKEYKALMNLKDKKIKGSKVSPLYNYDFIQGIYYAGCKEYKQAINCLKQVNTQNMNPREIQLVTNELDHLTKGA